MRIDTPFRRTSIRSSRLIRLVGIACSVALIASTATADNDLDVLLNELSFDEPTSDVAAGGVVRSAKPIVPTPEWTPAEKRPALMQAPRLHRTTVVKVAPQSVPTLTPQDQEPAPVQPAEPLQFSEPPAAPQPDVIPEPIRDPEPLPMDSTADTSVDFDAMFSSPECHSDAVLGYGNHYHPEYTCLPHRAPVLPPASSLRQYFRSPACDSDVWRGYEREYAERCHHRREHLDGRCDCFNPDKQCHLLSGQHASQCNSCDANSCDCK